VRKARVIIHANKPDIVAIMRSLLRKGSSCTIMPFCLARLMPALFDSRERFPKLWGFSERLSTGFGRIKPGVFRSSRSVNRALGISNGLSFVAA
jgi:hypothetical protein